MLEEFEFLMEQAWEKVLNEAEDKLWEMRKPLEQEEK
jgi:hypothetical protein